MQDKMATGTFGALQIIPLIVFTTEILLSAFWLMDHCVAVD